MFHEYDQGRSRDTPRADGSILHEYVPFWSVRRANHLVRVIHEITHFTHPDDDAYDDYGRALYVTMHQFVVLETRETLPLLIAECPQFTTNRDRAPARNSWPIAVKREVNRLIASGVQVFTRHFVCDEEDYDLDMRRELPSQRSL